MQKLLNSPFQWHAMNVEFTSVNDIYKDVCDCCMMMLSVAPIAFEAWHRLPPFIIRVPMAGGKPKPFKWRIYHKDGTEAYNLDNFLGYLYAPIAGDERIFMYRSEPLLATVFLDGCYWSAITFQRQGTLQEVTYRSDFFFARFGMPGNNVRYYKKIRWGSSTNFGGIPYTTGYKHEFTFDSSEQIEEIEEFEEGEERDDNAFVPTIQKTQVRYIIQEYVTAGVAEALQSISLHDTVELCDVGYQGNDINIKKMYRTKVALEWDSARCNAVATITFYLDEGTVKTNCDEAVITQEDSSFAPGPLINPEYTAVDDVWAVWIERNPGDLTVTHVEFSGIQGINGGNPVLKQPGEGPPPGVPADRFVINSLQFGAITPARYFVEMTPIRVKNGYTTRGEKVLLEINF